MDEGVAGRQDDDDLSGISNVHEIVYAFFEGSDAGSR